MIYYFIFALTTAIVCYYSFMKEAAAILGARDRYKIIGPVTKKVVAFFTVFVFAPMFIFILFMPNAQEHYLERLRNENN